MKKLFTSTLLSLALLSAGSFVQSAFAQDDNSHTTVQKVSKNGTYEGVIRVKFRPEMSKRLAALDAQANKDGNIQKRSGDAYLRTGIASIDAQNQVFNAENMRRVFRHSGKHEAKHQAWGLHLWYEIKFNSKEEAEKLAQVYGQLAEVQLAEAVHHAERSSVNAPYAYAPTGTLTTTPTDTRFNEQWHYKNTGQQGGTAGRDIKLTEAWAIETGNSNVIVAVEDGGIDIAHPDLKDNIWRNTGEIAGNGIDDDNNGFKDDVNGFNFANNVGTIPADMHGTHVAGTVAAETNNGVGVAGVAGGTGNNDGVKIMPCTVFGTNDAAGGFAEAYPYAADNGAVISQNSWGYTQVNVYDQAVLDGIDYFIANAGGAGQAMTGGIVIFAAGNSNATGNWWPGCYDKVVAVAATNNKDVRSYYSNYGAWVDISAPGGEQSAENDPKGVLSTLPTSQGSYGFLQGTSMACPHVSGVAALILSKFYGTLTPAQVRTRLVGNTDPIDALNSSTYAGKLGSGRLNAYKALTNDGTTPSPTTYCTSKGNNSTDEWIASVTVGSMTNTSGNNNGYKDNTSVTATITKGAATSFTLTPGFRSSSYNEGWRIWIDLNNDKDFDDTGEQVFSASALSSTAVSGSFTVPTSATATTTRMRISMKYNAFPTQCESFSYGEVEDYTVNLITGSTTCNTPTGQTSSNITSSSFTLGWTAVSGATSYNVQYRRQGTTTWTSVNATSNSVNITGATASTTYEWQVRTVCSSGTSAWSASATVTTTAATVTYCASKGNNVNYEWIDLVKLGTINRTSSKDAGYYNGTALSTNLTKGTSYTISYSAGFASTAYTEYWRVWIDYNKDGDFLDTGEQIVSRTSSSSGTLTTTFTVPTTATTGTTRMRVSMKESAYPTSCETFTYGEVEDYTINIVASGSSSVETSDATPEFENEVSLEVNVYPNPVVRELSLDANSEIQSVEVYNMTGARVMNVSVNQETSIRLDVSSLDNGMYVIRVNTAHQSISQRFVKQ
ncbi:MAG: hypothetical protein OHK0038_16070 [Flammeovirgaceae bacterium]